jgi:UPF0148 protein
MDSEKDKKVKRIARFLEMGGTMLAEHCKVCGAPKFRYQGTVICPICDVREEEEAQEPAAEVQVPETRPYTEKDRPSFETKKRVPAHRQKPRFGRTSEDTDEEEKPIELIEEENSKIPSEREETRRTTPAADAVQATPSANAEKPAGTSKLFGDHGDRKVLENLLFKKMVSIATSLQDETNPRSIAEDFELIEKGLKLIEHLGQL